MPRIQPCLNAASVHRNGRVEQTYAKRELPNYQVSTNAATLFRARFLACSRWWAARGLLICEDAWHAAPARDCAQFGAELLVVINASPFHIGKSTEREQTMQDRVLETGCRWSMPIWWVGQDEMVFEGRSLRWTLQESWQDVRGF